MASYRKHKHPQVHIRLPRELKEWVQRKAESEDVPMNTAFINCLEKLKRIEEVAA